jgi:hypothetical protein
VTRLLCVIVLATACSSRPGAPAHPERKPTAGSGSAVATTDGTSDAPPDDADARCARLVAHALALGDAERPADQKLTADERSKIEAQLRSDWAPKCQQMTSRDFECALAARTLAAISACGG